MRRLVALIGLLSLVACGGKSDSSPTPIPRALFTKFGTGDTVFDMPTDVARVRITGAYTGFCQNFIVHIGGEFVVNEILGTCSNGIGSTYDGIHLTVGGVTEIVNSTGVAWTFTEVR